MAHSCFWGWSGKLEFARALEFVPFPSSDMEVGCAESREHTLWGPLKAADVCLAPALPGPGVGGVAWAFGSVVECRVPKAP